MLGSTPNVGASDSSSVHGFWLAEKWFMSCGVARLKFNHLSVWYSYLSKSSFSIHGRSSLWTLMFLHSWVRSCWSIPLTCASSLLGRHHCEMSCSLESELFATRSEAASCTWPPMSTFLILAAEQTGYDVFPVFFYNCNFYFFSCSSYLQLLASFS